MPSQMVLAPPVLSPGASLQSVAHAELVRKAHPLYSDVALRLLMEILNGLFTTVRTLVHIHARQCAKQRNFQKLSSVKELMAHTAMLVRFANVRILS